MLPPIVRRAVTVIAPHAPLLLSLLLLACASGQRPKPSPPPSRELVVDEAIVVEGRVALDARGLPPLPEPLPNTSDAFQRGHAQAMVLLDAAGPPPPAEGADQASYEHWTRNDFTRWMAERAEQTRAAVDSLGAVQSGPASEHVVAAALVGLIYTRLTEQLHATPAPAHLAADASMLRHYHSGLDGVSDPWREAGERAFFHCAKHAALQTDAAYGLWLQLCHDRMATLREQRAQAEQRAAALAAEQQAERLQAAGPPPPGPSICWNPHSAAPAATAAPPGGDSSAAQPSGDRSVAAQPPAAADAGQAQRAAARHCARPSLDDATLAPPEPRTARDALYGVRDERSGVRISLATEPLPSMDLRPLGAAATHAALAACMARHAKPDAQATIAVHASLDVDARGRVTRATLAPEPSDDAAAPSAALTRCITTALRNVDFDCSPDARPTQAKALLCLRHEP